MIAVSPDALGRIACIDNELRVVGDFLPVVGGMVRRDDDAIVFAERFGREGDAFHLQVMAPHAVGTRDEGVVVIDVGTHFFELFDQLERGAFAHIINVGLVGEAEHQDSASADGLTLIVEGPAHALHHVLGHLVVDFAGKFDEARGHAHLACFPSEVEGVDRDAVAAEAGAGVEGLEAEGFGGGGLNHFPDVDAHGGEDHFHFVDEGDVDGAVDVFQQLGSLRDFRRGNGNHFLHSVAVEGDRDFTAGGIDAADELRDGAGVVVFAAGVFALGGEGEEEVGAEPELGFFEGGEHDFARGSRVGAGFENDDLAGAEGAGDVVGGLFNEAHVRLEVGAERGGDADDDGVGFAEAAHVGGGIEATGLHHVGDHRGSEVLEVVFAGKEGLDLAGIDVEPDHGESGGMEGAEERESRRSRGQ